MPPEEQWCSLLAEPNQVIALKPYAHSPDPLRQQLLCILQPQFRLMQTAKIACGISLESHRAFLTAPLHMCSNESLAGEETPSPQNCLLFYHAINWLRELLNSFAPSADSPDLFGTRERFCAPARSTGTAPDCSRSARLCTARPGGGHGARL